MPAKSLQIMSLAVLLSSILTFAVGASVSWRYCTFRLPSRRGRDVAVARLRKAFTYLLSDISNQIVLRGPLLLLTLVGNHNAVAIFNTELTLLRAAQTPLAGLNRFSLRYYAIHWFSRQHELLQTTVKQFSRIGFLLGVATMALIMAGIEYIAAHIRMDAATVSLLLAIPFAAMAWSLFVGPTSQLLVMSGHVHLETRTATASAAISIAITYLFAAVPNAWSASLGIGAALLLLNTLNFILVRNRLKINPSII